MYSCELYPPPANPKQMKIGGARCEKRPIANWTPWKLSTKWMLKWLPQSRRF